MKHPDQDSGQKKGLRKDQKQARQESRRNYRREHLQRNIIVLELCRGVTAFAFVGISFVALEAQLLDPTVIDRAIEEGMRFPGSLPQMLELLRSMGLSDQSIINCMYGFSAGSLFVTEKFGSLLGELKKEAKK